MVAPGLGVDSLRLQCAMVDPLVAAVRRERLVRATGTAFRGQVFRLVAGVLTLRDRDLLATVFPELANRSPSAPSSSAVPAPTSAPVQGGS